MFQREYPLFSIFFRQNVYLFRQMLLPGRKILPAGQKHLAEWERPAPRKNPAEENDRIFIGKPGF